MNVNTVVHFESIYEFICMWFCKPLVEVEGLKIGLFIFILRLATYK